MTPQKKIQYNNRNHAELLICVILGVVTLVEIILVLSCEDTKEKKCAENFGGTIFFAGMDPQNERKMFQQLVRAASQLKTPQ